MADKALRELGNGRFEVVGVHINPRTGQYVLPAHQGKKSSAASVPTGTKSAGGAKAR